MARTFKQLMERKQVSQQQVANDTGIDKNTLSALVHGRKSKPDTIEKLAKYFEVAPNQFYASDDRVMMVPPSFEVARQLPPNTQPMVASREFALQALRVIQQYLEGQ